MIDPARASSRTTVRVRFCETDLMGIVHHGNHLLYFEAGRVDWLKRRGVTYATWASRGLHLPVVDAEVKYHKPARFDDELVLETRLTELRAASVRYAYTLLRDGILLAEGSTRLACVDDAVGVRRLPDDVREVFLRGEIP